MTTQNSKIDHRPNKLGVFVGENNWTYFKEIYSCLSTYYQTEIFENRTYNVPILYGRLNRWALNSRMQAILNRCDVSFFEWASDLLVRASSMPKHSRIVTRLHSFELFDWAPRIDWNMVDKIILVSKAMQQKFSILYPDHARKTEVVNNGISLEKFTPLPSKEYQYRIGMLCHVIPRKRVYEMVLNLNELNKRGSKYTLTIAGKIDLDQRYMASINRLVKELNLQDSVVFEGNVVDTSAWLQNIDVLISNSYWEGQQVALLEALASGCYCLSHSWDGANEILPDDNLFYTCDELIDKLQVYSDMPENQRNEQQKFMREIAFEKFDINSTTSQIYNILKALP